ncbi:hypothetical protein [Mesorhizobium sp.]|uniref:hypothetical protein n=1 Tax=Mesorhizobium sp. TaxID=1871066 RepID=UPI0025B7F3D6|nr:hypothetical protein [Mesorhizobium sp.]
MADGERRGDLNIEALLAIMPAGEVAFSGCQTSDPGPTADCPVMGRVAVKLSFSGRFVRQYFPVRLRPHCGHEEPLRAKIRRGFQHLIRQQLLQVRTLVFQGLQVLGVERVHPATLRLPVTGA